MFMTLSLDADDVHLKQYRWSVFTALCFVFIFHLHFIFYIRIINNLKNLSQTTRGISLFSSNNCLMGLVVPESVSSHVSDSSKLQTDGHINLSRAKVNMVSMVSFGDSCKFKRTNLGCLSVICLR